MRMPHASLPVMAQRYTVYIGQRVEVITLLAAAKEVRVSFAGTSVAVQLHTAKEYIEDANP